MYRRNKTNVHNVTENFDQNLGNLLRYAWKSKYEARIYLLFVPLMVLLCMYDCICVFNIISVVYVEATIVNDY